MLPSAKKITILIPVFNREKLIIETLSSVNAQTYPNISVLIYDDGSSDQTVKACQSFSDVTIIKGVKNKGVGYARHTLLKECETEYACWWDSDDLCNIHRIEKQVELIDIGYDLVYTAFTSFRDSNNIDYREDPKKIKRIFAFASMLFKVDLDTQFDPNVRFGGEDCRWSRQMKKKHRVAYIEEVLYYVRYHKRRIGNIRKKLNIQDRIGSYAEAEKRLFGIDS